jgi:hypothetical protein
MTIIRIIVLFDSEVWHFKNKTNVLLAAERHFWRRTARILRKEKPLSRVIKDRTGL